ncbi:MAG: xanthine dehydrogenase family protein molybdopterin-binding subunit, partial [Betaproteobacteria bacterium]|nr:xanthine dehydrogenase family protein molybdopterin-binding subunit [Betaproteobacteria bacterium]
MANTNKYFGARVRRTEDPALLRGQGCYVDDIHLEGMLEASFVRSPHAHARVKAINTQAALALPGVRAVLTYRDLPAPAQKRLPLLVPNPAIIHPKTQYCLAKDEVCFVGEALAAVVADNRYIAEDAAALVEVDYETLPAMSHCRNTLAPGAAGVHSDLKDNLAAHTHIVVGKPEEAFKRADLVVRDTYWQHRGCAHPMETRGVVAEYRAVTGELTTWCSGQSPFLEKKCLVDLLDWNPELLRVIHPDVGGGFGPKTMFYVEQAVLALLAVKLKRPVKWIEDRREHFLTTTQERDQRW